MAYRPTISVYIDDQIADLGYYRNWRSFCLRRMTGSPTAQKVYPGNILTQHRFCKRIEGSRLHI